MKLLRKKGSTSSICMVYSNSKCQCYGCVGRIADLMAEGLVCYDGPNTSRWMFIPADNTDERLAVCFGSSCQSCLAIVKDFIKEEQV